MTQLLALLAGSIAGYIPHAILGDQLSLFADFMVSSLVGGVVYVAALVWLRKLRGD